VMARVQRERDHFVSEVLKDVAAIPRRDRLSGHARFTAPGVLAVDDRVLVEARAIVIATGARPMVPKALAAACGERVLTHETVFDLPRLPKSLAVIGAGPLGLELAVAFARLGVRTNLFDHGQTFGGARDPRVQAEVQAVLGRELDLNLGASIEARRKPGGNVAVTWTDPAGKTSHKAFEYLLSAAGRLPALDGLDLNMSGLEVDSAGVPVFDMETMRCGKSAIFIAGDADNARPVLHEAAAQGELAGRNAARLQKLERRPPGVNLAMVYTDPDIAVVGDGFDPKKAKGWAIGCSDDNGRARVDGRDAGILVAYASRADGVIVGGEFFGPDVEHLAHLLAWATQLKMTVGDALKLPFYHPTMEESLRSCLRDLRDNLG